jgi:ribosomal protein S18 acetylase RimI-like enzyme
MDPATPPVVVRRAHAADADVVGGMLAEALADKYGPAFGPNAASAIAGLVRHDLARVATSRQWVAELEGRLAGSVHLVLAGERDRGFARTLAAAVGWPRALWAIWVLSLLGAGSPHADEAYVDELGVAEWARRRGVGRALLAACEAEARRAGRDRLTLWVTIDNAPARALYEGCGFRESWRRAWLLGRLVFRSPGAIFMEKLLSPP